MKLSKEQLGAYSEIVKWLNDPDKMFFKLGGFAGTGKTFLLSYIIKNLQIRMSCHAPTGKAASVLASKLKGVAEVTTVHKAIYSPIEPDSSAMEALEEQLLSDPNNEDLKNELEVETEFYNSQTVEFKFRESNALEPGQLVIVDEASMVPERMMKDLLATGCKILFVGDPGQLPPVKSTDWFGRLDFDVVLTEVHRQALDSPIIRLSMDIRNGDNYYGRYNTKECRVIRKPQMKVSDLMSADQLITGSNDSRRNLNRLLRKKFKFQGGLPLKGEKLICLKNHVSGFINGVQGTALSDAQDDFGSVRLDIDYEGAKLKQVALYDYHCQLHYDNNLSELPWYMRQDMQEFDFAYAITCHKSQGSEWDNVVVVDDHMNARNVDFRKRWLYTAATRASKQLALVT